MKLKNLALPLFIALLLAVFFLNRKDVQFRAQNNFSLQPIGQNGLLLQSDIHLNNPNMLSCTIKSMHEEFRANGRVIGILDQEINQGIPGMKESVFPVSIRFTKDDFLKPIPGDSTRAEAVNIEVSGEIVFTSLVSSGSIKVRQNATVATGSK